MMRLSTALLTGWLLLCSAAAHASVTLETFKFSEPQQEQDFKDLLAELRCLVCQNQSLLDSDAELAHDLREEVYGMVQQGNSDAEIVDFMVARYGDFVLYRPPLKPATWLIWFGPFALLLLALALLWRALRRQRAAPQHEISAAERQRLEQVLRNSDQEADRS